MTTVYVWPALGQSVPAPTAVDDPLPASGASYELTTYIQSQIFAGRLLTYDPTGDTDLPEYDVNQEALFWADLTTRAGDHGGQALALSGRAEIGDGGEGFVFWDAESTEAADGGSIAGTNPVGRWKRPREELNARWFGATGDGVTNDRPAILTACQALPESGGTVYIPAGTYILTGFVETIIVPSYSTVYGDGPATILRRTERNGKEIVNISNTTNVRIHSIRFERSLYSNFQNTIIADDTESITIDHCEFEHLEPEAILYGSQLPCVLSRRARNFSFHNNRSWYMQCKAGGSTGDTRVSVCNNHFYKCHNFAVSVVSTLLGTGDVSDVIIQGNIVEEMQSQGAFFLGSDGESLTGDTVYRINVSDNIVYGVTSADSSYGVLLDLSVDTKDITIHGNTFHMTDTKVPTSLTQSGTTTTLTSAYTFPDDCVGRSVIVAGMGDAGNNGTFTITAKPTQFTITYTNASGVTDASPDGTYYATPGNGTMGILVKGSDEIDTNFRRITITNNKVYGVDQAGIEVQGSGTGLIIAHNMCEVTRGIRVRGGVSPVSATGIRDAHIHDNIMSSSNVQGILLHAENGDLIDFNCHDNTCKNTIGGGVNDVGIAIKAEAGYTISGRVSGNRVTDTSSATIHEYGIRETGAGTFAVIYKDNDCRGCAIRGYNLSSTATGSGNLGTGFTTQNTGIATITSGASSVTIAHGLSHRNGSDAEIMSLTTTRIIPSLRLPNSGAAVLSMGWHSLDATNFVVKLSGATAETGYEVHWLAQLAEHV